MKSITRLSLALMMFSLISISYLATSVFAQSVVIACGNLNTQAEIDACTRWRLYGPHLEK